MKSIELPELKTWADLCQRPTIDLDQLNSNVMEILNTVREKGDEALMNYALAYDKVSLSNLIVTEKEITDASKLVDSTLKKAIELASSNISKFHKSQFEKVAKVETSPGVTCWRESKPISKVGLYIPGGTAPLFSTVLMLAIPAKIAGCKEIILCTPPRKDGSIDPAILYSASVVGVTKIIKAGGAQAIAALTFGTESTPKVDKIFGPGNQYVTKAKEIVRQYGVAIDMPAGPSELLVIADESSVPSFVASDLLSQAEHGTDSQVILLSNSKKVIEEVFEELDSQLSKLPRKEIAEKSLNNSTSILMNSIKECFEFSNLYAPEHLIVASEKAEDYIELVNQAGSVFLGNYSCESAGDYASGTNHTLPTNGYARNYSGVSLDSFLRKITFQSLTKEGIQNIGPAIECMAEAEQLFAHKNAVTIRLNSLKNE